MVSSMTVKDYFRVMREFDAASFRRMLKRTLRDFYLVVKGFHGDLHMQNVMVNVDAAGKPVSIKIIDYGSMLRFRDFDPTENMSLSTILKKGHRNMMNRKLDFVEHFPVGTDIPMFKHKRGKNDYEFVRSNRNMLERLGRSRGLGWKDMGLVNESP
eukprot:1085149-Pyramimonas_sp.AAC.1